MNYRDIPLKISYISSGDEAFSEILNPLLAYTKIYKRSVGFFNSSALNFIGDGIWEMARNGGKIYLAILSNYVKTLSEKIKSNLLIKENVRNGLCRYLDYIKAYYTRS